MSRPVKTRLDQLQGRKNVAILALETAAAFTLRLLNMGDRRLFPLSLAAGQAMTLPFATGKGGCYRLFVLTTYTGSSSINTQAGVNPKTGVRDILVGYAGVGGTTSGQFAAAAVSAFHTITMNGTTSGGVSGSYIELEDVQPGTWRVAADLNGSGTVVTPFS